MGGFIKEGKMSKNTKMKEQNSSLPKWSDINLKNKETFSTLTFSLLILDFL